MKYRLERTNANDEHATLVEVHFENNSFVENGSLIMTFETSKAAIEVETEESGEVFTSLKVGDEVCFGDVVAYQNENPPKNEVSEIVESAIFTEKAKKLIRKHNLSEAEFSKMPFVSEKDVLALIETGKKQIDKEQSTLHGYVEPPVAYMSFTLEVTNSLKVLVVDLIRRVLLPLVGTQSLHLLVNNNGKIVPYDLDSNLEDPHKLINKASLEVYRGKKTSSEVLVCLSHLVSNMEFEHTALLYPGSQITIASAENSITGKIKVNLTYDHRYLDGHQILRAIEGYFDEKVF